jgi:hypothetical protein
MAHDSLADKMPFLKRERHEVPRDEKARHVYMLWDLTSMLRAIERLYNHTGGSAYSIENS